MQDCDIVVQFNDGLEGVNTGCYLARPTPAVVSSVLLAISESKYTNFSDDQDLLNRILKRAVDKRKIKIVYISTQLFLSGYENFWYGKTNSCDDCVIVHNN